MQVQSFHVIVNLEYLLVLSNVFMSALTTDEATSATPATIQQSSQAVTKQTPATVKAVDEEPPQITVQISIKDPEIVLLADARDKDTNALILKVRGSVYCWTVNYRMCKIGHEPFQFCFIRNFPQEIASSAF